MPGCGKVEICERERGGECGSNKGLGGEGGFLQCLGVPGVLTEFRRWFAHVNSKGPRDFKFARVLNPAIP